MLIKQSSDEIRLLDEMEERLTQQNGVKKFLLQELFV